MLQNPAKSDRPRLILFIDEASRFFPPHPKNPSPKEPLKMLLKQCRKYRVLVMIASQNYTDLDYKGMTQAGYFFIGHLTNRNDWTYLQPILEPKGMTAESLAAIPNGQMFAVDTASNALMGTYIKNRWLYSEHGTPIGPSEISDLIRKSNERRSKISEMSTKSMGNSERCPRCLTKIPDNHFIQEVGKYICPGCNKWITKEEMV
jgi:hypothetical protein